MLRLSDSQLDAWIAKNGPVPSGYGAFAAWLDLCDRDYKASLDLLQRLLSDSDAPAMEYMPQGLESLFADDQQPVVFSPGPYVIPGQTPMSGSKAQK